MRKALSTLVLAGMLSGCSSNIDSPKNISQEFSKTKIKVLSAEINTEVSQNITPEISESREISKYQSIRQDISVEGQTYTAIREFFRGNSKYYLAVNLTTNHSEIILAKNSLVLDDNSNFQNSSFKQALGTLKNKKGITNTGLQNDLKSRENTVYMTADFCPSSKTGFEKEFFKNFIKKGHKNIAIAITASWIKKHKTDFEWLIDQKNKHNLNITWVNHTFNHKYDWGEPLEQNFLLKPGTNLEEEVLELEKILIENDQTPSIFLRFPGLVSDAEIREKIIDKYSLIFIGSDAWLAKGKIPRNGSIILIHGNKNEPLGIEKANQYLENKDEKVQFGNLAESL